MERYHGMVFHLARGIVGDWHRSEDVCQEVFTLVYRKISAFRRRARFSTWLYRITVHAALKARRRWKRLEEKPVDISAQVPDGDWAVSFDKPAAFEGEEIVERLLRPLPEKLRVAVLLREAAGLSYEDIARVLQCSRGAVEQRLHRAMTILREIWNDETET